NVRSITLSAYWPCLKTSSRAPTIASATFGWIFKVASLAEHMVLLQKKCAFGGSYVLKLQIRHETRLRFRDPCRPAARRVAGLCANGGIRMRRGDVLADWKGGAQVCRRHTR